MVTMEVLTSRWAHFREDFAEAASSSSWQPHADDGSVKVKAKPAYFSPSRSQKKRDHKPRMENTTAVLCINNSLFWVVWYRWACGHYFLVRSWQTLCSSSAGSEQIGSELRAEPGKKHRNIKKADKASCKTNSSAGSTKGSRLSPRHLKFPDYKLPLTASWLI